MNIKRIIFTALSVVAITLACSGCSQRELQIDITDPNGTSRTYYYKSNSIASDARADSVKLTAPDGTVLEVVMPVQNDDSIKATALVGGVPVVIETK